MPFGFCEHRNSASSIELAGSSHFFLEKTMSIRAFFAFFGNLGGGRDISKKADRSSRRLSLESLENRELLSVSISTTEFAAIRAEYANLNLSAKMTDYNIIEVGGSGSPDDNSFAFSDPGLRSAINRAINTPENDLIVIRTGNTSSQNTITLDTYLAITSNVKGSVTIVSLDRDASTFNNTLTIDANKKSTVLDIGSGATVALAGLTFTGGYGGGIDSAGMLTVDKCTITGNSASSYGAGGGIYCSSTLTVTSSKITGNSASYGGGIYCTSTLTVKNSKITGNSASYGGGIYSDYSNYSSRTVSVTDSTISTNTASNYGGGIYIDYYAIATVTGNTITGNSACYGGGIYSSASSMSMTNNTITENKASDDGGGIRNSGTMTVTGGSITGNKASDGGGICNSGTMTVTDSSISGNRATSDYTYSTYGGGGIYNSGTMTVMGSSITGNSVEYTGTYSSASYGGGGIFNTGDLTVNGNSSITKNSTTGNAGSGLGGGILNFNGYSMTVESSTIAGNSAQHGGGGIYISSGGTQKIINSMVAGNSTQYGGGIFTNKNGGALTVTNCTVAGNLATGTAGKAGAGIYYAAGTLTLNNTIVAKNSGNDDIYDGQSAHTEAPSGNNSLIGNGDGIYHALDNINGNIVGGAATGFIDPQFALIPTISASTTGLNYNSNNWNLNLKTGSPAIDKGNNNLAVDAKGNKLTKDLAGRSRFDGQVDMGAYECQVLPPDLEASNGGTVTPNPVTKNNTFSVTTGTIQNVGEKASGNYTVTFYALTSTTQDITTGDKLGSVTMASLAAGASTTVTLNNISTASLAAGTYYIGWNITGVSGETVTNNNSARNMTALTVNPAPAPDLAASNGGTAPTSVTKGNTFSVTSGTIQNICNAASGSYTVTFYLLTNTTQTVTTGTNLGSVSMSSLAAGASTASTLSNISTTSLNAGTYYIGWDITGVSGETVTSNNSARNTTALTVNPAPLTAITLSTTSPQVGVTITTTLAPAGATATYQWQRLVNSTWQDITLNGKSSSYTPVADDVGYQLRVTAIGTGNYTGSVTSNPTNATMPAPILDLVASNGGTAPTSVTKGGTFSVTSGTIQNIGNVASGSYTVTFYLLTSTTQTVTTGTSLGSVSMASLAAGASTAAALNNISTTSLNTTAQ